ncbi:MAG: hypothetical protein HDR23_10040 [Lachnospiraceae bacterium]|nr:hypothetical protein [Lachnospiraceae bacterium]
MRLNDVYLEAAYREASINQKKEELEKDGYQVLADPFFGLYAERAGARRVYEFKYRNGDRRNSDMEKFLQKAKEIEAEPIVVYMLRPNRDSIEFDELGELIMGYFMDNFPSDLDELSSHTRPIEVYIETITDIHLTERWIEVKGEASVTVSLQYGSDREQEDDDEEELLGLPMTFDAIVNWSREIEELEYEFDMSEIE